MKLQDALQQLRSVYQARVAAPLSRPRVLVSGNNNAKIGRRVLKGKWKGFPIYMLTLEERRTCWDQCPNLERCYGNNMNWAIRVEHGPELETALVRELAYLGAKHPQGFVVRLHILGDFYSTEYVQFWADAVQRHPNLHIFGYSARLKSSPIGQALERLRKNPRVRLRFSNQEEALVSTDHTLRGKTPLGIVCPNQTHEGVTCASCTLCWELPTTTPVVFLEH